MTFNDIIKKIKTNSNNSEIILSANYIDRRNIVKELNDNNDWKEAFYNPSKGNCWRLFRNIHTDDKISINDGESDFFDDIVVNGI